MLRETLEAALIISILLAYLKKTEAPSSLKNQVWFGALSAAVISGILAYLFSVFLGGFTGVQALYFEGGALILASLVLGWMIVWMMKHGRVMKSELIEKMDLAMSGKNKYAIISLAFVAVFREGVESALFIAGISTKENPTAVWTSTFIGIITATLISVFFFKGVLKLNLKQFFNVTSIILVIFAAGMFSVGIHEFQEAFLFGSGSLFWNVPLFVLPLSHKTGIIGPILRTLFGYKSNPSLLEIGAYLFYWVVVFLLYKRIQMSAALSGITSKPIRA